MSWSPSTTAVYRHPSARRRTASYAGSPSKGFWKRRRQEPPLKVQSACDLPSARLRSALAAPGITRQTFPDGSVEISSSPRPQEEKTRENRLLVLAYWLQR